MKELFITHNAATKSIGPHNEWIEPDITKGFSLKLQQRIL